MKPLMVVFFFSLPLFAKPFMPTLIAPGSEVTCAHDGEVTRCWGKNEDYLLEVPKMGKLKELYSGSHYFCAREENGRVHCWGAYFGSPTHVPPTVKDSTSLATSTFHACSIVGDGVKCWSSNAIPVAPKLNRPKVLATTWTATCALVEEGIKCWEWAEENPKFIKAPSLVNPTQLCGGEDYFCALDDKGVTCWGGNEYGQLNVPELRNPKKIACNSGSHTCAMDDRGVSCWGDNSAGQLAVPPLLRNPTDVFVGQNNSCALTDGGVECWGYNFYGQLNIPKK